MKEGLEDITRTYLAGFFLSREIPAIVELQVVQLTRHVDAGSEMRSHLDKGRRFALKATLAGHGYLPLIREWRGKHGYYIRLFFLSLQHPEEAIARVATRVAQGDHNVSDEVVRRRFHSGLKQFNSVYKVEDDFLAVLR